MSKPIPDWDKYFMNIAKEVATRSKDNSTQVGCVIVGPDNEIRSTGYNSFPSGIDDNVECRHERPEKYLWIEHAERNAIYNAAKSGVRTKDCKIYIPWFPCIECSRAIIQSGISEVVCYEVDESDSRWGENMKKSTQMLTEANIKIRYVEK